MRRLERCDGVSTAEYLAVLLVVALVAAVVSFTPLGGPVAEAVSTALCRVAAAVDGRDCGAAGDPQASDDAVRPSRCDVLSQALGGEVGVDVLVFEASTGVKVARVDRSDGTTTFTVVDDGSVGVGVEAGVEVQTGVAGAEAIAEAGVGLAGELGQTWVVPTSEADDLQATLVRDQATERLAGPLGPVAGWIGEQLFGDVPDPDIVFIAGGVNAYAEASAEVSVLDTPVAGAGAGVTGAVLLGVEIDTSGPPAEHRVTEYLQLDAGVAGNLTFVTAGVGGELDSKVVVKVVRDTSGQLVGLEFVSSVTGTAIGELGTLLGDTTVGLVGSPSTTTTVSATLPVDDQLRDLAEAWLRGQDADGALFDRIADTAIVSVEQREGDDVGLSLGAKVALGVKLGLSGSANVTTSRVTDAYYLGPPDSTGVRSFVPFTECLTAAG